MRRSTVADWVTQHWVEPHAGNPGHWKMVRTSFGVLRATSRDRAIEILSQEPRRGSRMRLVIVGSLEEIRGRG